MGGKIVASQHEAMDKGQAERLFPLLEQLLDEAGAAWEVLDAIAVGTGPGNFTGIRIAVSAARGLALGLGIPAIGVSLFQTTQELSRKAQVAVKTTRDNAYFMDFDKMPEPVLVARSDLDTVAMSDKHAPEDHVACMLRLAALCLASDDPIPRPAPLYIRPADAAPASDPPPVILP